MSLTNEQIAARLRLVKQVWTPTKRYANEVVRVEEGHVVVRSEKTNEERTIPFAHIRQFRRTDNSRIALSLARVVGIPGAWDASA